MVAKIVLLGMEIVIIYGNILYVESCKKKLQINEQYQVQAMALVVDSRKGGGESIRGQHSTSDKDHRVNGKPHIIIPHPDRKQKDCVLCFKINVPGGRRETTYTVKYMTTIQDIMWENHSEKI